MDEVKIYTYSSIRGPGKKAGAYGYILETGTAAGWTNKKGEPVKNRELWQQLGKALAAHETGLHLKEDHPYRDWLKRETEIRRK